MSMFVGGHSKHTQFVIFGCEMVLYNAPTIKISITKHSHVEVEKQIDLHHFYNHLLLDEA
jgi:hypothetical protein